MRFRPAAGMAGVVLGIVACADSASADVQLYGTLDAGLLYVDRPSTGVGYLPKQADPGGRSVLVKDGGIGASLIGVRGSEPLGGGLRATFRLQGNVNLATGVPGGPSSISGTASFWNQFATVGLAGRYGEVSFGRQVSPMYYPMAETDARAARFFGSALTGLVALNGASGAFIGNNSNSAFGTIYNDNAIVYVTPSLAGLVLRLGVALGEGRGRENLQQSVGAVCTRGGLKLSALYYNGDGNNLAAASAVYAARAGSAAAGAAAAQDAGFSARANTNRLFAVGALQQWGRYTVSAGYYVARNPAGAIVPGGSASLRMWTVAAGWRPRPDVNVTGGYYRIDDRTNGGHHASQLALGVEYDLSRRSILYVQAARVTNEGANMNFSPIYATPVAAGRDAHAAMAGIRHSF